MGGCGCLAYTNVLEDRGTRGNRELSVDSLGLP